MYSIVLPAFGLQNPSDTKVSVRISIYELLATDLLGTCQKSKIG